MCKFAIVPCPYLEFGCGEELPRSEMYIHTSKCPFTPTKCSWCNENVQDEAVSSLLVLDRFSIIIILILNQKFLWVLFDSIVVI